MAIAFLVFMKTVFAQSLTLIAHYPLKTNTNDTTGNNTPMELINTPFQEGGIYCTGNYLGYGGHDSCHACTPPITNFNFESFSVSAKFKVSEFPSNRKPVFVCGEWSRWLAYYLQPDSTIAMKYNNNHYLTSTVAYTLDTWHEATITYIDTVAKLYLDDSLALSFKLETIHSAKDADKKIGITDFSEGLTFKGIFSDLRIYAGDVYTKVSETPFISTTGSYLLSQNYPNPFNAATTIFFEIPNRSMTTLRIYDLLGQEVKTLVNEIKEKGYHQVIWDGKNNFDQNICSGVYICRLNSGSRIQIKKLLLLR
jgi:hypothetical protein